MFESVVPLAVRRTVKNMVRTRPLIMSVVSTSDLLVWQENASLPTPGTFGLAGGQVKPGPLATVISNMYIASPR
jgi:hypothetical protein